MTTRIENKPAGRLSQLFDWLTAPHRDLTEIAEKRNARLMASLILILLPLLGLVLIASGISALGNLSAQEALRLNLSRAVLWSALLIAYVFSRTRYHLAGTVITLIIMWLLVFQSILTNPKTPLGFGAQMLLMILPVLIGSAVFRTRGIVITAVLTMSSLLAVPIFQPVRTYAELPLGLTLLLTLNSIVLTVVRHRQGIDTESRQELVAALEAAVAARKEAENADRLKSEFLATMSHELRTPLHAIIGYADIQLAGMVGPLPEGIKGHQERIMSNAEHLLSLINDVLDISKIEAGRLELADKPFKLLDWVQDVTSQTASLAQNKNLAYRMDFDPTMPEVMMGDPDRLKQIAINLIGNAVKFTEQGEIAISITRRSESEWELKVADTGMGIPREAQQYIFDEFRQIEGGTNRKFGGTGLGLAIVRKLVMLMHGKIDLKSEIEKGTTFTISLPLHTDASAFMPAKRQAEVQHVIAR
jgi:signal transduction histidine kinase